MLLNVRRQRRKQIKVGQSLGKLVRKPDEYVLPKLARYLGSGFSGIHSSGIRRGTCIDWAESIACVSTNLVEQSPVVPSITLYKYEFLLHGQFFGLRNSIGYRAINGPLCLSE